MNTLRPQVPFCKAPWHSISLAPTGKIGPCCLIPFGFGDLSEGDTLQSAWVGEPIKKFRRSLLQGDLAPGCLECKAKEADGFVSAKAIFDQIAEMSTGPISYTEDGDLRHFYHLDISLSNKCNLKCRFCYSGNSTAWFRDRDEMLKADYDFYADHLGLTDKIIDVPANQIEPFLENLKYLQQIEFKGGEPFMSRGHIPFLEMLIKHDVAKDVDILYTANGTLLDSDIFLLWKKFRRISFTVSVDGTGPTYQYVRGGRYTLEEHVLPHLLRLQGEHLDNLDLNLHYTICAYNLLEIPNFLKWHNATGIKYSVSFGLVDTPAYLSVRILPREIIERSILELAPFVQNKNVKKLISALQSMTPAADLKKQQGQFLKYTQALDKIRKTSLGISIPELASFYESLES